MRTSLISILAVLGGCSLFTSSSSSTIPLHGSDRTPAASGQISTVPAPNGNIELTIAVDHLAPPQRIAPSATTYVVWIVPNVHDAQNGTGVPTNAGALQVGRDLHAQLQTVTPYKNFRLEVTPEPSPMTQQPTAAPVLSAQVGG